jgi:DNA-binding MarR family transcriptional regulator
MVAMGKKGIAKLNEGRAVLIGAILLELRKVSAFSVLFSQAVADRIGVNPTDQECGDLLNIFGPMTAGRLAEISGLTTGAITGVINRLERAGFVRRVQDPTDRRRVIVHAVPDSDAARKAAKFFEGMANASIALCERYSDEDLAVIFDFVSRALAMTTEEINRLRQSDAGRDDEASADS